MDVSFPPPNFHEVPSNVSGIEVYAPIPEQTSPQQAVVEFTCPQCGATTAYSVEDGGLKCSHCGYYSPPERKTTGAQASELEFTVETMQDMEHGWGEARKDMECMTCGAITSISEQSLTHTCPFCGSNHVIQKTASQDVLRPRYLIPFQIEAQKCLSIAQEWMGSSWMTPKSLKRVADQALFSGVFLPYWTFDTTATASWRAEVGHTETERYFQDGEWKTRTVIRWRWESGMVNEKFDDLLVPGTNRLSSLLLNKIKAFQMSQLRPYEAGFLAGFQALSYDRPLDNSWEIARQQMREHTRLACRKQASTPRIRNFSMKLDFGNESWRYILLPIYLAGYRYANQNFQVIINGQSGQIAGQRPVDWKKVWLVVGALLTPGLLLALIGAITLLLGGVGALIGGVGFVLLLIGVVISVVILRQATSMDDI